MDAAGSAERGLWDRLETFEFDPPGAAWTFAARVARENGWSDAFTRRVVHEYKRFAFLAVVAGHPVTPSDAVDQVWHLHLTYTRNYWEEFCPRVLKRPLHHGPTQGGGQQRQRFWRQYEQTLASYRRWFGESPPADIWPPAAERFDPRQQFVRVNVGRGRPSFRRWRPRRTAAALATAAVLTILAVGCGQAMPMANPLNWRGGDFLALYISLMAVALVGACLLRWSCRPPSDSPRDEPPLDPYDAAYLAGGPPRARQAAVVNLALRDAVHYDDDAKRMVADGVLPADANPLEYAIYRVLQRKKSPKKSTAEMRKEFAEYERRLRSAGLLVSTAGKLWSRWLPAAIVGCVGLFGVLKILVGLERDKPVGYLSILTFITFLAAAMLSSSWPVLRSKRGDTLLKRWNKQHQPLSTTADQLDGRDLLLAVALFGPHVLQGTALAPVHQYLASYDSSGGSGGCGSDGGDGGGGCGGCGGCGGGD